MEFVRIRLRQAHNSRKDTIDHIFICQGDDPLLPVLCCIDVHCSEIVRERTVAVMTNRWVRVPYFEQSKVTLIKINR